MANFISNYLKKFDSIIGFVIIEILGIVAFALGSINTIFLVLGIIAAVLLIPFAIKSFKLENLMTLFFLIIPLIFFLILSISSPFGQTFYSVFDNILYLVGSLAFVFLGVFSHYNKAFKLEHALLVILVGIALLTTISVFYTIHQYGAFYLYIFKDKYLYFNGTEFLITNESKWLFGYSFFETSTSYMKLHVLLMCLAGMGALFVSPKRHKIRFWTYAIIGVLGLVLAILLPMLLDLLFLVPLYLGALLYRFLKKREKIFKISKIVVYSAFGVFVLLLVLFIINAQEGDNFVKNIVSSIPPLNRFFNLNNYVLPLKNTVVAQPSGYNGQEGVTFFDILFGRTSDLVFVNDASGPHFDSVFNSGSSFFDMVYESGLIGAFCFLIFAFIFMKKGFAYFKTNEAKHHKLLVVSIVVIILFYPMVNAHSHLMIHQDDYFSFAKSPLFYIALFLIGRIFQPKNEVKAHEVS
ncbi:MAG: hypothetical protein LBR37_02625 [Erysipelotrichaceae bacterium]|jgi:hypothetical protein|nr:hypothetical protein [Erysipelotrichaceae bacterium]